MSYAYQLFQYNLTVIDFSLSYLNNNIFYKQFFVRYRLICLYMLPILYNTKLLWFHFFKPTKNRISL